jgi:hypothetical protein
MGNGVRIPNFPCKSRFSGNFHDLSLIWGFWICQRCWLSAVFMRKFPKPHSGKITSALRELNRHFREFRIGCSQYGNPPCYFHVLKLLSARKAEITGLRAGGVPNLQRAAPLLHGFFTGVPYNKYMRKFLLGFLMFVMLTPGLACGPFMGMGKAQAFPMMDMPDCKGMGMDGSKEKSDDHVFFKDCSKTDLSGAGHASLKAPDLDGKIFLIGWAATTPEYSFTPSAGNAIRGPPPDWPEVSQTQPSILLTTQRFRE